jgi:hypothetical protein
MSIRVQTLAIPPFSNHLRTTPSRKCNQNSEDPSPETGRAESDEGWSRCIVSAVSAASLGSVDSLWAVWAFRLLLRLAHYFRCSCWMFGCGAGGWPTGAAALDGDPPVPASAGLWRCRKCENVPRIAPTSVFFRRLLIEEAARLLIEAEADAGQLSQVLRLLPTSS